MAEVHGTDSEVGQLTAVLVHRPGPEIQRLTPRHAGRLLFGTLPWISKARQEHDVLCEQLRSHGAEVLYFTELLQDILEYQPARDEAVRLAVADVNLGDELRRQLQVYLADLDSERLAQALIAGLTPEELRPGHGVVFELLDRHDFVLDPLPNLVFTRDSSFWVGSRVAVASLAAERRREADLVGVVYRHHPRFTRAGWLYQPDLEHVSGGDVVLMAPGVVAVGVGQQTTAAGAERLAGRLFDAGLARTVLAVPMAQLHGSARSAGAAEGGISHLDTICTVVSQDAVLMHPAAAYTLTAHTIAQQPEGMRVSRSQPFLEAAAQAMGIDRLHVIDSGTEPPWGRPGRWDDGSNVLAVAPGLVASHERNSETNARLEAAGIKVLRVPSSELGSVRGGPRCMTCVISRDPAAMPGIARAPRGDGVIRDRYPAGLGIAVPSSREATYSGAIRPVGAAAAAATTQPNGYAGSAQPAVSGWSGHGRWLRGRRGR
ncbi:MAG TPA: arginine deiminase family protein [Streptosporangiaceae bacterium]|nr:arginine deiminase family protein [Streptosporangiaceae bacterium]